MTTISCCIGDCKHILQLKPRLITEHIKKYHPQAYIQLNSDYIFYCATCDTFTSYIHFHCFKQGVISFLLGSNDQKKLH